MVPKNSFAKIVKLKKIVVFAVLGGILFGFSSKFLIHQFVDKFLFKYQEINVRDSFVGSADDPKGDEIFTSPVAPEAGTIIRYIEPRSPGLLRLNFNKVIRFDSFSLFFYGDMHSVSSSSPRDFWVYYQDVKGIWHMVDEVKNNALAVYRFYSPTTIFANAVEIVIPKASFSNTVRYGDLKFFQKTPVSLWGGIKSHLNNQKRDLIGYWFYYFSFFVLLFLPGYVILDVIAKRKKLDIDPDIRLIFSPIFSIFFLFLITLAYLLIGNKIILNFYWFIFFVSLIFFFKNKLFKKLSESVPLLLILGTALFVIFLVIAQRDYLYNLPYIYHYLDKLRPIPMRGYYGYEADNLFQWGIARVFLHRLSIWGLQARELLLGAAPTAIFDRTPVLSMITTSILAMFGESHFVYQRFLEILAMLYYGAMYLVIRTYFSKRVAIIVGLLMLLNVPLSFMAFNAELFYKYFALYPVLLALVIFFKEKKPNGLLMGILMGFSFLIHPMTLIFSAVIFILYLFRYRISFKFFKKTLVIFIILIFLIASWYFIFNKVKSQSNMAAPSLYLTGLTAIKGQQLFYNKLLNLADLFVPNVLLRHIGGGKIAFMSQEFWLAFLRHSLVANLTLIFFILLVIYMIKNIKKNYQMLILGFVPLVIFLIFYLHRYDYYGRYFLLYPFTIPFLLGYVTNRLVKEKKIVKIIGFGSYIFFMLGSLYFISGVFVKIEGVSWIVYSLLSMILLIYFTLSTILLKTCLSSQNRIKS